MITEFATAGRLGVAGPSGPGRPAGPRPITTFEFGMDQSETVTLRGRPHSELRSCFESGWPGNSAFLGTPSHSRRTSILHRSVVLRPGPGRPGRHERSSGLSGRATGKFSRIMTRIMIAAVLVVQPGRGAA